MTKHTPGPWWHDEETKLIVDANGDAICATGSLTNEEGNAPLIAAAPELLQALEAICEHANEAWATLDHDYHEVLAGNLGDAVDQARAVIAKAKGE